MSRALIFGFLIASLCGCTTTKNVPLNASAGSEYKGKSITYSLRKKPGFSAMTAGKATLGMLGGAATINAGNKIIRDNNIEDPAVIIAETLVNDLAAEYGLFVSQPVRRISSTETEEIASDYSDVDLVLDVQTRSWSFSYFPTDWNNYYVAYSAKLRLIDTKKSIEIASGSFAYDSKDDEVHPSHHELLDNQALGLKLELEKAKAECISEFRQRIFSAK